MSMNKTRYLRKAMLDHMFGRAEYSFTTSVYLALFASDPTDLGLLTDELSQLGYARVQISSLMGDAILSSGQIANSADISFSVAGEDWPEITHAGVMDSATIGAGNMLYFGPATTARVVDSGDQFKIRIGQLTVVET